MSILLALAAHRHKPAPAPDEPQGDARPLVGLGDDLDAGARAKEALDALRDVAQRHARALPGRSVRARLRRCGKYFLTPSIATVDTAWGPVRVKRADGFGIHHAKAEYEDVARIAREQNLPCREVQRAVEKKL